MKRITTIIFAALVLASCMTQKAAQRKINRIVKHHPELFAADTTWIQTIDTVQIKVPYYSHDTIVEKGDTIVIETERFKTVIQTIRDSVFIVNTEIKEQNIPFIIHDSIPVIQNEVIVKTEKEKFIPWVYWVLLGLVSFFLLMFSVKRD